MTSGALHVHIAAHNLSNAVCRCCGSAADACPSPCKAGERSAAAHVKRLGIARCTALLLSQPDPYDDLVSPVCSHVGWSCTPASPRHAAAVAVAGLKGLVSLVELVVKMPGTSAEVPWLHCAAWLPARRRMVQLGAPSAPALQCIAVIWPQTARHAWCASCRGCGSRSLDIE